MPSLDPGQPPGGARGRSRAAPAASPVMLMPGVLLPCVLLLGCACSSPAIPDPPASPGAPSAAKEPASIQREYVELQQRAMAEVRAWSSQGGRNPDPRPVWGKRLEEFAASHPGSPEAADALSGVMQMRAAMLDHEGFVADYDLLLRTSPDAPGVPGVFQHVSAMRVAEAGGREALETTDHRVKMRAWRRAAPRIAADMEKAIEATRNPSTIAAARYTIAMTWYQMDLNLAEALRHFKIVAQEHPTSTYAGPARDRIREIETLRPGNPAPAFEAVAIDGRCVSLSSLQGQIVLVDFWATWCQPCLNELPGLKRAHERYRGRGFTIVGVSADTDPSALSRFMRRQALPWPVIVAAEGGAGPADPIFEAYAVQALPMSYLIDRRGVIRARALFGEEVERAVKDLLGREL